MLTNPEQTITPVNLLDRLLALVLPASSKAQVHTYTGQTNGVDYAFEVATGDSMHAQMTGYGKGIKRGDYLVLPQGRYQIETIDYYTNPPHLWMASLIKVSD